METLEYAPGRLADVFGDVAAPTVLLWHGMQTDSRTAVRPLAELLVGHGVGVVAPDWNSHADDGGRADLLNSVAFARERADDPDGLVLVGWSMGGVAAAGLTLHADRFDVTLAHTVCLAGAFTARDPISGGYVQDDLPATRPGAGFTLLHGTQDDVVPVSASAQFAAALEHVRWPVDLVELPTDHGAIAGAVYDPAADRYAPATDPETLATAGDVAARIVSAARVFER